jgi:hypothetical protein
VTNVTADLDTRCGALSASGEEVRSAGSCDPDGATQLVGAGERSCSGSTAPAGFASSREQFDSLVSFLDGTDAAGLSHAELEERLDRGFRLAEATETDG